MKKLATLLLITLCAFISSAGDTNEKGEGKLYKGGGNISRPHKPSTEFISCQYAAGALIFDFPEGIEYADVTIRDQNGSIISSGIVTIEAPEYDVTLSPGMYTIELCSHELGTFAGTMEIY